MLPGVRRLLPPRHDRRHFVAIARDTIPPSAPGERVMSALPLALACILVFLPLSLAPAQVDTARRADSTKADTTKPPRKPADLGPLRTIEFDTDEGTWMNLDVSP